MTNPIFSKDIIGKKESVVDEVLLLNPNQTPLINLLEFGKPVVNTTHVWYEDEVFAVKSTVTAAATADAVQLTVADTEPFVVDSIVQVDEELMLVTAVDKATKKITVTRGYSETTPAAIVKDAEIEFLFNLAEEGGDIPTARYKPRKKNENYTQIFRESVEVSGTAQSIDQYGVGDLYDYEKAKKQLELALQLEKALINGIKVDNGNVRHMGGMRQFVKTNVIDANKAAVTVDMLRGMVKTVFEKGGLANGGQYVFIVSAHQKLAISDLQSDKLRITQAENSRGQVVDQLVTDFGTFPIVMNDNVKNNEIYFVDKNRMSIRPLNDRGFHHIPAAVEGDRVRGFVVGEYTFEFLQESAHARIKNLA